MTSLAAALLAELTDADLAELADRLRPLLASAPQPAAERWLRGADQIAGYISAPRSRVYALASAKRIPIQHDGSALIARTTDLDAWLKAGGAKRP